MSTNVLPRIDPRLAQRLIEKKAELDQYRPLSLATLHSIVVTVGAAPHAARQCPQRSQRTASAQAPEQHDARLSSAHCRVQCNAWHT